MNVTIADVALALFVACLLAPRTARSLTRRVSQGAYLVASLTRHVSQGAYLVAKRARGGVNCQSV